MGRLTIPEYISGFESADAVRGHREVQLLDFSASVQAPNTNNLLIGNGANPLLVPPLGFTAYVRAIRVVGGAPIGNVGDSARVFFFVGTQPNSAGDGDVAAFYRDDTGTNTLPVQADYGHREFPCRGGNVLYAIVTSPTSGRNYTISGTYELVPINVRAADVVAT